jgi:solute carrier family 35 protein F3/4
MILKTNFVFYNLQVMFKKMIGDATYGQVSLFFSLIGLLNAALLWPVCLVLYFSEIEILHWDRLPWMILLSASTLSLGKKITKKKIHLEICCI